MTKHEALKKWTEESGLNPIFNHVRMAQTAFLAGWEAHELSQESEKRGIDVTDNPLQIKMDKVL